MLFDVIIKWMFAQVKGDTGNKANKGYIMDTYLDKVIASIFFLNP